MTEKCIALVEWHWDGHHPTFFAHFILALEELGADILAVCPHPDKARENVAKLREQYGLGPARADQTAYRSMAIHDRRFQRLRSARISGIDWTWRHFRQIERVAGAWQMESGKRLSLLFYACIYDWDFNCFQIVRPFLSLPWSGLYLHALSLRRPGTVDPVTGRPGPEKIFDHALCKGVALLDEGMVSRFSAAGDKPVVAFPDLTDGRLPENATDRALEDRLRQFAKGRPIVGLFGYLKKSKGVMPLALIARHPRLADVCFAFGGEMQWDFSPGESEILKEVLNQSPNVWNYLHRIPSEEQLNSLMSACDVLYAAYLDFPHSSNIMAKAAQLKKPLIVSDGYLMAERVRRFRMGEVVPQGNVEAQIEAILKIIGNPVAWSKKNQPRWSDYSREHSYERLKEAFRELLAGMGQNIGLPRQTQADILH